MGIFKKYSLGWAFMAMFVVAIILMTLSDWQYFVTQQAEHHQVADVFGSSGFIWRWGLDTFSNWQADFLGQGLAVILGAYLIFQGSSQSKDTSDSIEATVNDIERMVRGSDRAEQDQKRSEKIATRGGPLRNYGLGIALIGAFLVSWGLMTWMGWNNFAADAKEHHEAATVWGTSGYIWEWMRQTFSNWQADFLGHSMMIVLPAYLLYKGSGESSEGEDRAEAAVERVHRALRERLGGQAAVQDPSPGQKTKPAPNLWSRYGLGILYLAITLITWGAQTWTGWGYFLAQQLEHHQTAQVFGSSGYIWLWGTDTFSNWQSDLLWEGIAVLLGAYLIFQGSGMSKDSDDRIEELANNIEARVRGQKVAKRSQAKTDARVSRGGFVFTRGLAYSMIIGGIISWALMTWMGWMYFSSTAQQHGLTATVFGSYGYIWDWGRLTLENWQSDLIGHAAIVILPAYLLYRESAESRESDDTTEAALQRIQKSLENGESVFSTAAAPDSKPAVLSKSK